MSMFRRKRTDRVPPGFRGVNVVNDGPAGNVPEPGGLPAADDCKPILIVAGKESGGLWVMPNVPRIVPTSTNLGSETPGIYR